MPDAEELADFADLILTIARDLESRVDAAGTAIPLRSGEVTVLRFIDRNPGATPSSVAAGTGLQRSNVSTAVRVLEDKGLVERRHDRSDARVVSLQMTAASRTQLSALRAAWAERLAGALGGEKTSVTEALALLTRIERGLEPHSEGVDSSHP